MGPADHNFERFQKIVLFSGASSTPSCEAVADVGFILDSSGSLKDEYHKEKLFIKVIARAFGISFHGSRAAVVTFSSDVEHSIKVTELLILRKSVDRILEHSFEASFAYTLQRLF